MPPRKRAEWRLWRVCPTLH